jgi:hypothetical protein
VVVTDLETDTFTAPSTFHGTTIGNHDLEIVDGMDVNFSDPNPVSVSLIFQPKLNAQT